MYGDVGAFGDDGIMFDNARGGDDALFGGPGNDSLVGDARILLSALGGDDALVGGPGNDFLSGDANFLEHDARGGDDHLQGGAGNDHLVGDGLMWSLRATNNSQGGDDHLEGGRGDDILIGDAPGGPLAEIFPGMSGNAEGGDDWLQGGRGNDVLFGDSPLMSDSAQGGDDTLYGGPGNDILYGDAELVIDSAETDNDTFVFAGVFDDDDVRDFRQGEDTLQFNVPGVTSIDGLSISTLAGDTVISAAGFGTVTLTGFTGLLTDQDIFFV
jgi:serralysin